MYVVAIIAAAGQGRRFGSSALKQFAALGGRTLLERCVDAFARCGRVDEIIVATPPGAPPELDALLAASAAPVRTVRGGERRQDSVANAFDAVPAKADVVVIHDAARALVSPELIGRTIDAAAAAGAAVAAVPSRDTVKRVRRDAGRTLIAETLPRDEIYLAQTPQAFRREVLADAVALGRRGVEATDEAMLAEKAGHRVEIVDSDETNIKVTTRHDLMLAEALVEAEGRQPEAEGQKRKAEVESDTPSALGLGPSVLSASSIRVGVGYDLHRLVEGRRLVLGGVTIPFDRGPHGHSDGDAVCHALTDAILGAVAAGDIGGYFPDTDPRWKDADSLAMLGAAVEEARARGYVVENADVVVILERPKLAPHLGAIRAALAACLGVGPGSVSVKGKTNEGVGAIGRGDAVAVHAVVGVRAR